jgi:endoglucanase Acf2
MHQDSSSRRRRRVVLPEWLEPRRLMSLPAGWTDLDIGSPAKHGSANDNAGTWTVAGGGADIWGTSDQFNFAYQTLTGNGSIVAHVNSLTNTDPWAKTGVMFRNSTNAASPFADVVVTPGEGVNFQWRNAAAKPSHAQLVGIKVPVWVKLTRSGNNFSGYYSTDDVNWKQIGATVTLSIATTDLAGLAVTAHNNTALNTAVFTNVAVQSAVVGKIAFTTFAQTLTPGYTSAPITVQLEDASGNAINAGPGGAVITLKSSSSTGKFFDAAGNAVSTVTVPSGSASVNFEYSDTTAGKPTLTASIGGISATQQATVSATAIPVLADPTQLGSYASQPDAQALNSTAGLSAFLTRPYNWINRPADAALPTNKWFTNILVSQFAGNLFPYPLEASSSASGITNTYYSGIDAVSGNIIATGGQTLKVGGQGINFTDNALLDYGDWTVHFRMEDTATQYMNVTLARGVPYAWYEFTGINPLLSLGTTFTAFNASGGVLGSSFTTDHFRVSQGDRQFGVFAPAGTTFTANGNSFNVTFSGSSRYIVIGLLPDASNSTLALFYQHAYAIPRNSAYNWTYDAIAGHVTTTWNLSTQALMAGASLDTIQGWLPTNYRDIVSGPVLLSGMQYPTIQGPVKIGVGHSFTIVQPSNGVNFVLPAPKSIGGTADYNPAQMNSYIQGFSANYTSDSDTYSSGKLLQTVAANVLMDLELGDTAQYNTNLNELRSALTDWFTWTPGETTHYFAYYPSDKSLTGFQTSFGSDQFNDHHFHYGYFTAAAGVLAMLDPTWASQYGAMATMVAQEYANWDRSDTQFPFLRTFDAWTGHSYAGGLGSSRGNNQESTSEAIQSWLGLVILGQALNNPQMTAAGMMGYTMETKAESEYWLNIAHGDLNPADFNEPSVAINFDDTRQYQTYFGLNPEYSLGIEGLPLWPSMDFIGKYPANMQKVIDAMLQARTVFYNNPNANTWASFETIGGGTDWLNVNLSMEAQINPQAVAVEYARMWTQQTAAGTDPSTGRFYYEDQSNRTYGLQNWNYHLSMPLGGVYTNSSGKNTYVLYNALNTAQTVDVLDSSGKVIDTFIASPRKIDVVQR